MRDDSAASASAVASVDEVRAQLAALASPQHLLEEIFLSAPVGLQLCARDGRCVLVNPMHTRLFGAVPPPEYNIFEDTILEATGMAALVRRAFEGERISIPPLWYDARELANVQVSQGRRFAVGAELVPLRSAGAQVSHVLFVFHDVTEAQQAREEAEAAAREAREAGSRAEQAAARSAFLAEAGRLLSSTLDLQETLVALARLATPSMADFCVVDLVEPDGTVRRVAAAHADASGQPLLDQLLEYPPVPGSVQPARRVLESGQPELLAVVDAQVVASHTMTPQHRALMQALGVRSHMAVPMVGRTGTVGVISLGYVGHRRYGEDDLVLGEALGTRAALAIENARLYDAAARSEERFRHMADAVPQLVWITKADGEVEFFNRQWWLYTGADSPASAQDSAARF
ncbi:MAG TPA: GAF domain-containing protein, partial [Ramlibacter sp.]|nr:GAF domain-containing protein [Ramlibacter sp.]